MELTDEDVREILELIENSKFDYFEIEYRGLKLTVSATPLAPARPAPAHPAPDEPAPAAREARAVPDGLIAIPAPMVGTFYPAPEPGAPLFLVRPDAG